MKVYRVNNYDESALCDLKLSAYLIPGGTDYFMKYAEESVLPDAAGFRKNFLTLLQTPPRSPADMAALEAHIAQTGCLARDRELCLAVLLKMLELIKIPRLPQLDEKFKIHASLVYRGWLFIDAYIIKALETVLPREAALDYYKAFVDWRNLQIPLEPYDKVSFHLFLHKLADGPLLHGVNCVEAEMDDSRAVSKITKCLPCEVLRELNDPQAAYAIICHGDFSLTQKRNPAFRLTREKALTLGMPYCGHVWHDTRVCKDLSHPGRRFWECFV